MSEHESDRYGTCETSEGGWLKWDFGYDNDGILIVYGIYYEGD